jgi:ankyrin repeat protein
LNPHGFSDVNEKKDFPDNCDFSMSPNLLASRCANVDALRTLIKIQPNFIEDKDNNGNTVLHHCILSLNPQTLETLKVFIDSGAFKFANSLNNSNASPIYWICFHLDYKERYESFDEIFQIILEHTTEETLNVLLEAGYSPLFWAARFHEEKVAELLVKNGAETENLKITDEDEYDGETACSIWLELEGLIQRWRSEV